MLLLRERWRLENVGAGNTERGKKNKEGKKVEEAAPPLTAPSPD